MRTAADLLRDAAALIADPQAWCKGVESPDQMCAAHALCEAHQRGRGDYSGALDALASAVGVTSVPTGVWLSSAVGRWNDADERTHAEVLAAFEKAARLAEAAP